MRRQTVERASDAQREARLRSPLRPPRVRRGRPARNRDNLARGEMLPAMRTDQIRRGFRTADSMDQGHRRPRFVTEPGVAPSHHRDQHGIELESFPGQPILDRGRCRLRCARGRGFRRARDRAASSSGCCARFRCPAETRQSGGVRETPRAVSASSSARRPPPAFAPPSSSCL